MMYTNTEILLNPDMIAFGGTSIYFQWTIYNRSRDKIGYADSRSDLFRKIKDWLGPNVEYYSIGSSIYFKSVPTLGNVQSELENHE